MNLGEELLQSTPGGRDIWALIEYKVPGLVMSRPDVGGTSGGLQGTYSARGTTSAQNSQFLNGINVGDPAAIGAAGFYYDYDAFEEIQVSTGAHDITVPTSGVFLNMATKSGGNVWAGRATFAWEGNARRPRTSTTSCCALGFRPNTNEVDYVSDVNVSAGGPLIKNKVRIFGSFRDWRVHVNHAGAELARSCSTRPTLLPVCSTSTWQVNDGNKVTGFWSRQKYDKPNRLLNNASITVPESTSNEDDIFNVYQGLWNSVLTSRLFMDARLGYNTIFFPTFFNGTEQSLTDTRDRHHRTRTIRRQWNASAPPPGQRDAAVLRRSLARRPSRVPLRLRPHARGDREPDAPRRRRAAHLHQRDGHGPERDDLFARRSSRQDGARRHVALLPGQLQPEAPDARRRRPLRAARRLSAGAGQPAERVLPEPARATFAALRDVVKWHTVGPRFSAIYDLQGDGRTALKALVWPLLLRAVDGRRPSATST